MTLSLVELAAELLTGLLALVESQVRETLLTLGASYHS